MVTRENVTSAYELLLGRKPESDDAISSWLNSCSTTDELIVGIVGSDEFSKRAAAIARKRVIANSGRSETLSSSKVKPEPSLVQWLRDLDSISGWLSPSTAFMSAGLAQIQADHGYRGNIAEIGVYHGKYLTGLSTTLRDGEKSIAIDVFDDQSKNADLVGYDEVGSSGIHDLTQQAFLDNAKRYCPNADIAVIQRSSLEVSPADILEHDGKVRFFSIDGGHTVDVLLNDLHLAVETLAPHGIISIDDILNPQWAGIITGTVRFFDGETDLRPIAFVPNKLLCAFEPFVDFYKKALLEIAPTAIQRRDVEFSNFTADQYIDNDEWALFVDSAGD